MVKELTEEEEGLWPGISAAQTSASPPVGKRIPITLGMLFVDIEYHLFVLHIECRQVYSVSHCANGLYSNRI